ncbi:MAG: hypothetical protein IPK93_00655 [Solirubrobacterales bacterium]|nr:hypothetical protein [Solirubrobacterales bacterium]
MEQTKKNQVTKGVTAGWVTKAVGAGVLTGSLVAGADNIETLGLTTAAYAAAEGMRSLLSVRNFGSSGSHTTSHPKHIAGHTS